MPKYPRINVRLSKDIPTSIIAMAETDIDINGGHPQVNPAARYKELRMPAFLNPL